MASHDTKEVNSSASGGSNKPMQESLAKDNGIIAYFANNSVAANLIMGLLLIGGLISGFGLNAQVFPTLNPGIITVIVPYPGATPSEVEESITRRVEEAVLGIEGVDEVLEMHVRSASIWMPPLKSTP